MEHICRIEERDRLVAIYLQRKYLQYDIETLAYVEGDIMPTDDSHAQHQLQDIGQEGNNDRLTRVLDLAYTEVLHRLYPHDKEPLYESDYLDNDPAESEGDDEDGEYEVKLYLTPTFSRVTIKFIARLIHEFMVNRAMAEWTSVTKPEVTERYMTKADDDMRKIQSALVARRSRVKIKMHPF